MALKVRGKIHIPKLRTREEKARGIKVPKLCVAVPEPLLRHLREEAKERKTTVSAYMRTLIRNDRVKRPQDAS